MRKNFNSQQAFTLIEVIVVLVVLGFLVAYAINKFTIGNVDNAVDESVIKDVVRQAQMRAMADISGAGWSVSISGPSKTAIIQKSGVTKQTYTIKTYSGVFSISFDNMGVPTTTITSGSLPFAIDPVTGFVE
jgi:prepilin-type N-terminal cleavage/methylation domain-containing protein